MDLNVRDWLIVIGALLATAVLLDGFRRMRKDRRDTIRLSAKQRHDDDDLTNPELPSGTARVVAVRETPSLHVKRGQTAASTRREPEWKAEPEGGEVKQQETDSEFDAEAPSGDDILFTDPADEYRAKMPADVEDDDEDEIVAGWSSINTADTGREASSHVDHGDISEHLDADTPEPSTASNGGDSEASHQELLVINAMAPEGKPFKGNDLLQILMACDVRYGKMSIFHRYENADGTGEIQFSVANLVEPGNFNLDEIDEFTSPGVVFFMHLPGPKDSIKAYEAMVETARCLVNNLEGELRDQTHSVATKQTLEHYKQRIRDFERRQLTLM
ncbi:Cell division protein ZipA [Zhongshania aliphaticivorans]|uniref:Cell division protein ZipA n=1 Tax=Zhongshania aliphaticivorans TaxID=1470434 RepID=A0A5S9NDM4_9GAMM|nr:cell division protein ZipA [Zhongshania aliphaticivorans]CAA0087822.1 Cell division protein ZipA [Zhongshania aliphaticivorans]CAA0115506.1 Cell division protein ZipA [Zhongshania aliphaticivorans]CAA0120247.1 Cell division protein ZipA [Zhongshania aliphaticivorans]